MDQHKEPREQQNYLLDAIETEDVVLLVCTKTLRVRFWKEGHIS